MSTETPRIDSIAFMARFKRDALGTFEAVPANSARQLERELTAAQSTIAEQAKEIERLREALRSLHDAVAEMRVPQNTAEAGLQIMITIGPALEFARRALGADK